MVDDTVNYEAGETPMTDYQFKRYEELRDEREAALIRELDTLRQEKSENNGSMTDYQYKTTIEMIHQILKANFEAGKTPEEVLEIIADLKNVK